MTVEIGNINLRNYHSNRFEASRPTFNYEEDGRYILLSSSRGEVVKLGKREFEIIDLICTKAPSYDQIAHHLDVRIGTVRNQLIKIYKRFGIEGIENVKKVKLIHHLVSEGYLSYEPSIDEDLVPISNL